MDQQTVTQKTETYYRKFGKMVYHLALKTLNDPEEAKDVLSEVFIKVSEHLSADTLKEETIFNWLYKVTINHCLNLIEKTSNRKRLLNQYQESVIPESEKEADAALIESDLFQRLTKNKDESTKKIIIYKIVFGMKILEIAKLLELDRKTVSTKFNRFLQDAKYKLTDGWEED